MADEETTVEGEVETTTPEVEVEAEETVEVPATEEATPVE